MPDLLRIPLRVADYGTRPARFVLGKLLELRRSGDDQVAPAAPEPAPPAPEPVQTAPKRRAPAKKPSVKATRRATRHEPTKGEAAAIRAAEREKEWGEDNSVGANVVIDDAVKKLVEP